jgi:small conductance mechanosensitive channel
MKNVMPIDVSNAWKSGSHILNGAISLLPNLILACIVFGVFLILASTGKSLIQRIANRKEGSQTLALLLGRLAQMTVVVVGFLIGFSVIAPSFHASDVIKMLGVGGVAIGFAFSKHPAKFSRGHSPSARSAVPDR